MSNNKPRKKPSPVQASTEVKQIRRRLQKVRAEISDKSRDHAELGAQIKKRHRQIQEMQNELRSLEGKEIEVTDHAIVRFLERIDGLDVKAVIDRMVTEKLREQVAVVGGSGKFPIEGGRGHLVMDNMRIITVKT